LVSDDKNSCILMKTDRQVLSDDWKRNWQQSIAVRISALALWVIMPICLGVTFYFISNLDRNLEEQFSEKADVFAHRLQTYFDENRFARTDELDRTIKNLAAKLGFIGIQIIDDNMDWRFGDNSADTQLVTREIKIHDYKINKHKTIKVLAHFPHIDKLVAKKRNHVLYLVIFGLVLFGVFLIWAIRTMVHRPLEKIVDATQAISEGVTDLRLDTSRQDEFGYIARFFNEMLDQLLDQQEKLKYAVTEAKNANSAKTAFLANMSHELRTPLNAIIGYADLLVEQANDLRQRECIPDLHKIRTAGAYLLDLINNILDLTKIEAGKTDLYYESVNIETMIAEIQSTMTPLVEKNKNQLVVELEENLGTIKTDYTKLRQSIFNLLSNACKFTEEGSIRMRVYDEKYNNREKIIIEIADTGTGMSNECLTNLFAPFARGRNSATLKISGTGLGLAISRHFCNLLGGEISVESTLGIGTVFKIHLPYIRADEQEVPLPLTSSASK